MTQRLDDVVLHWCTCGERWGHGRDQDAKESERHHGMGHKVYVSELSSYLAQRGVELPDTRQFNDPLHPDKHKQGGTIASFATDESPALKMTYDDWMEMQKIHDELESQKKGGD